MVCPFTSVLTAKLSCDGWSSFPGFFLKIFKTTSLFYFSAAISTDPSVLGKFRAGFNECAGEVSRYVERIEGTDMGMRQRLVNHLSHCVNSLNAAAAASTPPFAQNPPMANMAQVNGQRMSGAPNANNNNNNQNNGATAAAGIAFPGMTPPLLSQLQVNADFLYVENSGILWFKR